MNLTQCERQVYLNVYNGYMSNTNIIQGGLFMEEQKRDFKNWIKTNKKKIIITGVTVSGVIICILNKDSILAWLSDLYKSIEESSLKVPESLREENDIIVLEPSLETDSISSAEIIPFPNTHTPFDVNGHIRNLPEGRHASSEKIESAEKNGYSLGPNQTYVDPYTKGSITA